jgi:hypothetical protein
MEENMSRMERHLRAWPCGCREWVSTTVDGDTIEDEVTERFEPCPEYHNLQTEYERIEVANASVAAALAGPDASLLSQLENVAGEMERHHFATYEVRGLGA